MEQLRQLARWWLSPPASDLLPLLRWQKQTGLLHCLKGKRCGAVVLQTAELTVARCWLRSSSSHVFWPTPSWGLLGHVVLQMGN